MTLKLHFLLVTLLLTSSIYVLAISGSRPHRYGANATMPSNTSQMVADAPDGIEERGDDVRITTPSTFKVYLQRGELAFDLCPNADCIGENHVCYPTDLANPDASFFCGDYPSTCGYLVKMSTTRIWFTLEENPPTTDPKTDGLCFPVVMKHPKTMAKGLAELNSCDPKIGEHGAVTLHVKKASTSCPLIVKNAKINPPELPSTTGTNEKAGTTPESSEGMAGWLIAVIVICCFICAVLIVAVIVFVYFKVIKKSDSQPVTSSTTKKTTQPGKDQKEGQETDKPQDPAVVKQDDAQMKAVNQPLSKLEEAPAKSQQPTEMKQELANAKAAADPQPVLKKVNLAAAPEPAPVVKKQKYHFDFQGGNPLGFCRRLKSKSGSGRSYKKQDSMREPVRGKYTHLFILHVKDLAQHDPKYFDHNMIVSVVKNYPRAKNVLEREMKLLLKSTVDEMLVELAAMREDAHKILTAAGVEIDQKKYEALKIPPAARKLIADPDTPEYVKHYMFGLEFGTRIPYNLATLEGCSLSLLFVIAIYPGASEILRHLAASYIRSNMPVVEEYWDPAERTGCYFPISAILADERMKAEAVIADSRQKKEEAKKEEMVEASTQETGETTVDKQCIESRGE